jgi:chorismate mutase-like protein
MDSFTPLRFRGFKTKPVLPDPQPSLTPRSFDGKAPIIVSIARFRCHDDKLYHGGFFSSIDTAGNDSGILIETGKGDKMRKMGHQELENRRKKIDLIDQTLLSLLNQRVRIAHELGKIKKEMGRKIYDPGREKKVLERLKSKNRGSLKEEDLKKIFTTIMRVCRKSQA